MTEARVEVGEGSRRDFISCLAAIRASRFPLLGCHPNGNMTALQAALTIQECLRFFAGDTATHLRAFTDRPAEIVSKVVANWSLIVKTVFTNEHRKSCN